MLKGPNALSREKDRNILFLKGQRTKEDWTQNKHGTRQKAFGVSINCGFIFGSLWHFITKCSYYRTLLQDVTAILNTKYRRSLFQNASDFLLQMRQMWRLLQKTSVQIFLSWCWSYSRIRYIYNHNLWWNYV